MKTTINPAPTHANAGNLTSEQQDVCFFGKTEAPFSGAYWDHHEPGNYHCVVCNTVLFMSTTKFDSGTGWPSFSSPVDGAIEYVEDRSHGMVRTGVRCGICGAHLGHMFEDGPKSTGKHYCINSLALKFRPQTEALSDLD